MRRKRALIIRVDSRGFFILEVGVALILTAGILVTMGYYAVGSRKPYNQALDNVMENRATARDTAILQNANREMAQTYENLTAVGGLVGSSGPSAEPGIMKALRPLESKGVVQNFIYPGVMDIAQRNTAPPLTKDKPDPQFPPSKGRVAASSTSDTSPNPEDEEPPLAPDLQSATTGRGNNFGAGRNPDTEPPVAPDSVRESRQSENMPATLRSDRDITGSTWRITQTLGRNAPVEYEAQVLSVDPSGAIRVRVLRLTPYTEKSPTYPPGGIARPATFTGSYDGRTLTLSGQWQKYIKEIRPVQLPLTGGRREFLPGCPAYVKTNNVTYRFTLNAQRNLATGIILSDRESTARLSATRIK